MAQITVSLPRSMTDDQHLIVDVANVQQLFRQIREVNQRAFNTLFRELNAEITPKAFVAMFVNDEQAFDVHVLLNDGDTVTFGVAIAGG
ncbi:molybdopterin converting factor small subunit [Paraburkholderia sp. GAS199]|uniref:hypothetical protein n=1 Tax=Paraburkholderia sp. GAS199 TaxID=3035126 RepID=UPI003D263E14